MAGQWPGQAIPDDTGNQENSQPNMQKWESDEDLGEKATIVAILYCNLKHPELMQEFPDCLQRSKQIAKIWRKLTPEEKKPYLLKARKNRVTVKGRQPKVPDSGHKETMQPLQGVPGMNSSLDEVSIPPPPVDALTNKESKDQSKKRKKKKKAADTPVVNGNAHSAPARKPFNVQSKSATPGTPGSNRIHSIVSLTPNQNRWRIRARVTQKSNIRPWSNPKGEGKWFSVNLIDESGEIRAAGFHDVVDKYNEMLEVNKVYYISKASLKTANKQYTSVNNDYEMTFNKDTLIEPCSEETDLPTITFDFVPINTLDSKQPQAVIDVIGVVKSIGDVTSITTKQNKELTKRDVQLADQSGMLVNLTLWGNDAENFKGKANPVLACKSCRLSDWGGRSLSLLDSSPLVNPKMREATLLKRWWKREGHNLDFQGYRSGGGAGAEPKKTRVSSPEKRKKPRVSSQEKPKKPRVSSPEKRKKTLVSSLKSDTADPYAWLQEIPERIRHRCLTDRDMSRLAQGVGSNWEFAAIELGLSKVEVDHCKMENPTTGLQMNCALHKWRNSRPEEAHLAGWIQALKNCSSTTIDIDKMKKVARQMCES